MAREWGLTPGGFYVLEVWEQAAMAAWCRTRDKIAALAAEQERREAARATAKAKTRRG